MRKTEVHTLVIGSGAAGLNAALQLKRRGVEDVLILTEGLNKGTSINTGSDKQTYYKLSLCGSFGDSPQAMARVYCDGGAMHGDIALVEAGASVRAFLNLADLGVPFPTDRYGQYVGYKTDHDPAQRGTSIGPHTSREMCRVLIDAVNKEEIPLLENRDVIELITVNEQSGKRAAGAIAMGDGDELEVYKAENVILAVGGPGGIYRDSVYPGCHTGAIGLALREGAAARNLPESQFGLASTAFRWNVSGTYMQVLPRFMSVNPEDESDQGEFLLDYFGSPGEMNSMIFLKGYQWPFDSGKIPGGSSIIDILVYRESTLKGRKVYLDFRSNSQGFSFDDLSAEARRYLEESGALFGTPIDRLKKMNPGALSLYRDKHIDIKRGMLEIALCAQHNNGGLAADTWWQSENIRRLFPVGEVNGSHGIHRPGGSALNSGQVGGYRAAEYISAGDAGCSLDSSLFDREVEKRMEAIEAALERCESAQRSWEEERNEFQTRMSLYGSFIRKPEDLKRAITEARNQLNRLGNEGSSAATGRGKREYFRNRQLCFSHMVYLEAILFSLESGTGSRGSALVMQPGGEKIHPAFENSWSMMGEDPSFREKIQQTIADSSGSVLNQWIDRRKIPENDLWFETVWREYREGKIYR